MRPKVIKKRWVPKKIPGQSLVDAISEQLKVKAVLSTLIAQRNISDFNSARSFFNPDPQQLHDPFLMKDMDKAVERIARAIRNKENILFYGDYDVDGTTAVAIAFSYFREFYSGVDFYVPDRFKEGYGISEKGVEYAHSNGFNLIISLDCGIKAVEQADKMREYGIDLIIGDHHQPGFDLPDAFAVLNPKQKDCPYPYKELSGGGIAFKLISAFEKEFKTGFDPMELIDLVVVSIAADIVPLTGENRILAYLGLQKLNSKPLPGIQALIEISGVKKPIDITDIVFKIGPRINAAGRIEHASNAVKLLVVKSYGEAFDMARSLNKTNLTRKDFDTSITEEALKMVEASEELQKRNSTVLYNENWHKGVIGIVASRLIENFYRPTVMLTMSNGMAVGSARSIPGFNIYKALERCSDLLMQFGGHVAAAGLTLEVDKIPAFTDLFEDVVSETIDPEIMIPSLEFDLEISFNDITPSFCKTIKRFGPFGPDNMKPVFVSRKVGNSVEPRVVGDSHLKLQLNQNNGVVLDAIGFNLGAHYELIANGRPFDICYTIEENHWDNKVLLQLNIKDIQINE